MAKYSLEFMLKKLKVVNIIILFCSYLYFGAKQNLLLGQSHTVKIEQVRGVGDALFVDVYIRTDSLNFLLGASNFVFQVANPSAFVSIDPLNIDGPKIIQRGDYDITGSDPSSSKSYLSMNLSKIIFPPNTLNLSVLSNTSCAFPPSPPCGVQVPATFTRIARIQFKVADCNAISSMNWLTNRGAFNDFQGNPIPRAAFNYQSSTNFSLCPIQINGITTNDPDTTICPNANFTFSLNANNADSYQLWIDGVLTNSNLTGSWSVDTFTINHYLEIIAINSCGCQDTAVMNLNVYPSAVASVQSNDTLVCENTNFPLYFTNFTGTSIQWQESNDNITWNNSVNLGSNGQVLLAGPITGTTYYRAIAFNGFCSDTTDVIQVDVAPYPVSGVASVSADSVCSGDNVNLTVTGNNGNIQWQSSPNGITFWSDIPGANTASYTYVNLTASTYFRAVNLTCDTAITNVVYVKVLTPASGSFSTVVPPICAGGITIPLGATISGNGAVGVWSSSGAGSFTNPNDPNAQYISSILDNNTTVTLTWTVSTPYCLGSQSYSQNVIVGGNPTAIVNPIQPATCGTTPSAPLGASAVNGTGQWFLGALANGTFTNDLDPNTTYIPSPLDAGNTIELLWVVSSAGCPNDTAKTYLTVGDSPLGSFNTSVPTICAGDPTIPLNASVTVGTGIWSTSGAGFFSNAFDPNAQYISSPLDAGQKITLTWVVTSGSCPPVYYSKLVQVDEPPVGNFTTVLPTICAGGSSIPLNASVTVGGGIWSTNGQGTFSNFGDPNAVYYSSVADAGQTINITWTIGNGVCDSIVFTQPLVISNNVIIGSFPAAPPAICAGETTAPLGASVGGGASGFWTSPNGMGFFSDVNYPNATYTSSPFDQGQIKLVWNVTQTNCSNLQIERELTVYPKPIGIFNSNQGPVCESDSTDLLVGFTSIGTSYFSHNGNGNLLLQFNFGNSQGVRYEPSPLDVGDTVEIYWITQNGSCTPDTITLRVPISPTPSGSFNTVIPDICAGAITIPLGATVTNGVGEWSTPNGLGSFGDKNDPNTFYNSNLADAGQTITLIWTVKSPGCDSVQYTQNVNVLTNQVFGTFDFQPAPVCAGDATAPLGATAVHGTGTWSSTGSGFFVPNNSDPNAQYFSLASEAGDTIDLIWTISNPPCSDLPLKQKLIILHPPDGDFPVAPDTICFTGITAPLGAVTIQGTGSWQVIQGTGNVNDVNDPNAYYIPGPGDAAATIKLAWVVQNGSCPADVNIQTFFVSAPPAGDNITPFGVHCAGSNVQVSGTVVSGTGFWSTPNGNGTFLNPYSPNTFYQSSILDAGQNIQLCWTVTTTKCSPDVNCITVNFLNSLVDGSFSLVEDTICAQNATLPLNGIVTQGSASWSTVNGSGFFVPSILDPNAVYQSVTNDQNKNIIICWDLTNSGCDTTKICDTIFVKSQPSGGFPNPPQNICITDTTDTLFAFVNDGYGVWTTNGSGSFEDANNPVTRYVPGPTDGNQFITLTWNVISNFCDTVKYSRNFYVYDNPSGTFNTQLPDICAGEISVPLGATISSGVGFWSTNGNGGFTNTTNPNASYISVASDGNNIIDIYWNVFNGGCDTVQYVQQLQVDAPSLGSFNTILGSVCEFDTSINLNASIINGFGFWTSQGPGTFLDPNDPNTRFIAGDVNSDTTFFLEWNVINGVCNTVTYTRSIRVFNSPQGTFNTPVDTTCPGVPTNILLATITNGSGTWTTSGTGSFTNNNSGNAQYIPSLADAGQNITLIWNITNGTCDTLKLSQTLYVEPLPNTFAGNDTTICPGDTVQLQASGANFYSWFPSIDLSDPSIPNPIAVLNTSRNYIVRGYVNASCYTEDTIRITVNPGGSVQVPAFPQICRGDSVQLNVTGNNIVAWSWTPTEGLSDPTIPNPFASPTNTTVYTVTGTTTSGCQVSDIVIVNVIPFTAPVIFGSDACQGQDQFYIYAIKDATCGNSFWFNGNISQVLASGSLDATNPRYINSLDSILVSTTNLGNYQFTLACVNPVTGCIGLDEFDLDVIAYPVASFTSDKTICTYDERTVQFTSTSTNAVYYYWQFGDPNSGDLNSDTIPNPVHTFSGPGKYNVALFVMNELGCADLVILDNYIEVAPPNYYFPTAFSPNGDGLNDIFRALPPNSANVLSMKIWDRWGALVYESENDNKGWTGYTPDGKPFDPGTYTYKVLIQLPTKTEPTIYTGYVTLIR